MPYNFWNLEIILIIFEIGKLSWFLELGDYPDYFQNWETIPIIFELGNYPFFKLGIYPVFLELGNYPGYFWNWEIIPIIEFPEVSVPQRGKIRSAGS